MKSLLLALTLAFALPLFASEPTTTPSGVKVAKKKAKKATPAKPANKQQEKKK
jgi:hypothetical protein